MTDIFAPLAHIQPSQLLAKYHDWIYFLILLVFFISLAGIALRRHFQKPYIKPLIIAVGLFLTIGAFQHRCLLTSTIEGWGFLGYLVVIIMAGVLPFGLMRSLGASHAKALDLSYVLIYLLTWTAAPELFDSLQDRGMGIVTLGLTVWFVIALWKLLRPGSKKSVPAKSAEEGNLAELARTIAPMEERESGLALKEAKAITQVQLTSLEDMERLLKDVRARVKAGGVNFSDQDRKQTAHDLTMLMQREESLRGACQSARSKLARLSRLDAAQARDMQEKVKSASGKDKVHIKEALQKEDHKKIIQETLAQLEQRLDSNIKMLARSLKEASEAILQAPYAMDALPKLDEADRAIKQINTISQAIRDLDLKLVHIIRAEENGLQMAA